MSVFHLLISVLLPSISQSDARLVLKIFLFYTTPENYEHYNIITIKLFLINKTKMHFKTM